jgi:hypothetical protein
MMQELVYNKKVLRSTPHQSRAGSVMQPARAPIPQQRFKELEQLRGEPATISPREAARNHWARQSAQARNSNLKPESHLATRIPNPESQTAQGKRKEEVELATGPSNWEFLAPLTEKLQVQDSSGQAVAGRQANGNTPGQLTIDQAQTRSHTSEESNNAVHSTPATSIGTPPENGASSRGNAKGGGGGGEKNSSMIRRIWGWRKKGSKKGKGKEIVEQKIRN